VTLAQLLTAGIDTQRQYALVFGGPLATVLRQRWEQFGTNNLVPTPSLLTDGRYMLSADILSEVSEQEDSRRLLARMWRNSDRAVIAAGVTIVPWADAVALLPQAPQPLPEPSDFNVVPGWPVRVR
jgi:hypothetical protein